MANAEIEGARSRWRAVGWGAAGLTLLLPLIAMQFTREVSWTAGDFLFAAMMFGLVGLTIELAVRTSRSPSYRGGVGAAVAASFLIVWANGAVGMIGNEDNPYNLLFLGVIMVALLGSVLARFRARGMAIAMVTAAAAQVAIGIGGISTDIRGGILSMLFAGLWLLSAALFRNAARDA
ncbi:MAG TPA: hypothetical protein VGD23_02725 [Sphingomicrobium sp.]